MMGIRLRQARLASGMTLEMLADRLSLANHPITKAGLSKYELGKSQPNQKLLLAIANALGVRVGHFFEPSKTKINWIAFRRLATMPLKRQDQVKAYASHVVENQISLQSILFPEESSNFPEMQDARTFDDAERIAMELRDKWGLGDSTIDSLTGLVEDHGGVVVPCSDISRDFDGLAGRTNSGFPVAVVCMQVADDRRRYNLAHELGHLLMRCGDVSSKEEEKLANRFASALLVPASVAKHELGKKRKRIEVNELAILKLKHGFSMQGWARRAFDLEIIDAGQYKALCVMFSRNHWKKIEPTVYVGNEVPTRLKLMTLRAIAEGLISRERGEQICPGYTSQIELLGSERTDSASGLRRLPRVQRDSILEAAAEKVADAYAADGELTDFNAFGQEDLYVDSTES
ncbi:MAG: helix-turn-helix domain-containing protein [Planctomyces sp.]|nr:helix-turn-helix domain-containing protein [Planctomyces sp.]